MSRDDVLAWLNYRLQLANNKTPMNITDTDVIFIRSYIDHYKKKLIDPAHIIGSIQIQPVPKMMYHLDFMVNKLIADYKIEVKFIKKTVVDPTHNVFSGRHPNAPMEIEIVEMYI